jgi:hypothetical protein
VGVEEVIKNKMKDGTRKSTRVMLRRKKEGNRTFKIFT